MSRDAITEIEQARQKKQIKQTLEEASWDIPRLLKINARLVKENQQQAEQITRMKEFVKGMHETLGGTMELIVSDKAVTDTIWYDDHCTLYETLESAKNSAMILLKGGE